MQIATADIQTIELGLNQISGLNHALILVTEDLNDKPSLAEREAVAAMLYAVYDQVRALEGVLSRAAARPHLGLVR